MKQTDFIRPQYTITGKLQKATSDFSMISKSTNMMVQMTK